MVFSTTDLSFSSGVLFSQSDEVAREPKASVSIVVHQISVSLRISFDFENRGKLLPGVQLDVDADGLANCVGDILRTPFGQQGEVGVLAEPERVVSVSAVGDEVEVIVSGPARGEHARAQVVAVAEIVGDRLEHQRRPVRCTRI